MNAGGEVAVVAAKEASSEKVPGNLISRRRARFTSNIAGPIFFLADVLCILLAVPLSLIAYNILRSDRMIPSVHIFAFCAAAGTYLLIRTSRHAYRRTLVNMFEHEADTVIDALASVLIASALVWQFGMISSLSRGITILYVLMFSICLLASRPVVRGLVRHLAGSGSIEQRIVFYGADPESLAIIRKVIAASELPHLRFLGVADDRPKVKEIDGVPLLGGLD